MEAPAPGDRYHVAQANIAQMRADLGDPRMLEFVELLEPLNALADRSDGFVWRLQTDAGDATAVRAFDDDRVLFNLSVWRSVEALKSYVYSSDHVAPLRRRREWFQPIERPTTVLWWVPAGHEPSVEEAVARLDTLMALGPTQGAFTFRTTFPPPA